MMIFRILAASVIAASLLVAPAFAQSTAVPGHSESTTTTVDKKISDTDASGKTVTKHHRVVKQKAKTKVAPEAASDTTTTNSQ